MSRSRQAAIAVAALRVAYGAALAVAPGRTTRSWLGDDAAKPAAAVGLRALGAREIVLHFPASIGGDCSDIAATYGAGRDNLPDGAALKTLAVAGISAALSAVVVAALDS